ncbi:MAG: glycolate oxidase iron-sulfur subunit [Betaproteobacteria bacterium HGW-Betaproteobacteria-13]|jgi:glycolate oxidase iron-sulfur subunit|uniref:Glycolate oxidase iron-sulfur subunit n=1 Tax=Parazoarcus communis TaxID=41977 RepID=A0A2U8GWC9_9RHOO|nr:glycolate oxidase subunit GlcF [Parazoarcus communis]AWI78029.1 glycolate oxidase iron-sulfur subunit [Parazoarcus communis]PKO79498.1 MAG: glycolate oxidase iron-sulfur subunit [Betaproteobacteria bacterium HGW-Betaproteobacteria-13]
MQTQLADFIRDTPDGREADEILRNCVHCGFCTATCPTYQLLGDELDGPRGRIYLIKQVLEGHEPTEKTRQHLDRCLTCRSCESTCPSGVQYGRLVDIGRHVVEAKVPRRGADRAVRWALREFVPRAGLFGAAMKAGRMVRGILPETLKDKVPLARPAGPWPRARHGRRMLTLAGCVQPSMAPSINAAAARVLDTLGISLKEAPGAGCCGAVRHHLNDHEGGKADMKRNIDAWWPVIEAGDIEAIVMTASGCGSQVKDYGHILRNDPAYAEKARKVSELTRDISEVVVAEIDDLARLLAAKGNRRTSLAWHAPCSLQHGLKLRGGVERLLDAAGYDLTPVRDAHLCCGSAGTYSLLQPELSHTLRDNKLAALCEGGAGTIASANIGCITHLQAGTQTPVRHWIELVDSRLNGFPA